MKVELIEIGRVIPYAHNPRKNEAAIAKVAASIKEYGFRQPIVVDEEPPTLKPAISPFAASE